MIVLYTCINRRCDGKILLGTENLWGGTFYDFFSLSFFLHFFNIFAGAATEAEATVLPVSVVYIQFCCRSFESFASFFFFFSVLSQTNTNHLLYVRNFCCSSAFKRNETCMRYYDFRLLAYARWFSFLSLLLVGALFLRMPLALFLMVDKPNGMYKYIIAIIRLFYRWIMTWHLSVSRAPLLIALL